METAHCGAVVHGIPKQEHNSTPTKVLCRSFFSIRIEICSKIGPNLLTSNHYFCWCIGGGAIASHALDFINDEFIIAANNSKPILHIWPVNSQEQISGIRFVIPGKASALAVSPDGNYCVAAVSETIYVWQISTGNMVAVLTKHYQSVTALKFIDDGSHFISAGHDGMILVWKLSSILAARGYSNQDITPLYTFSDHTLPITDLYVGKGGMCAILTSVSLDRTCRIYDLASATLLLNLVFPEALTSVAVDRLETQVYVGTIQGNIFEFSLQAPPRTKEYHISHDALPAKQRFIGHKSAVSALSVSMDGLSLLSGGNDEIVNIWDIPSKQLIRSMPHKGVITNAQFILAPKAMLDQERKLQLITNNFKRMIDNQSLSAEHHIVEVLVSQPLDERLYVDDSVAHNDSVNGNDSGPSIERKLNGNAKHVECDLSDVAQLHDEIKRLQAVNKQLFDTHMKYITQ